MFVRHPSIAFCVLPCVVVSACAPAPKSIASQTPGVTKGTPAKLASPQSCFVLRQVDGPLRIRKGGDVCSRRFTPASTFKIPHTLIALQTGARRGPDERDQWDGSRASVRACEADQTLRSALQNSCVWYYRRTAAKIGLERMSKALRELRYGNMDIGNDVTSFWLTGPLEISADEQGATMEALARRTLPFSPGHMDAVDSILLQEPGSFRRGKSIEMGIAWDPATTRIHAKSGSADDDHGGSRSIRWFVGHLRAGEHRYAFASLVVADQELSDRSADAHRKRNG